MLKLITEEEKTIIEPINVDVEQAPGPVETTPEEFSEVDEKTVNLACEEAVNNLMEQSWDFIAQVNSVIATLELNYKEDIKKDVLELLNVIVDDSTINIGVLQKITNMMNSEKVNLLNAGEDKAEKLLEKPKAEDEADSE